MLTALLLERNPLNWLSHDNVACTEGSSRLQIFTSRAMIARSRKAQGKDFFVREGAVSNSCKSSVNAYFGWAAPYPCELHGNTLLKTLQISTTEIAPNQKQPSFTSLSRYGTSRLEGSRKVYFVMKAWTVCFENLPGISGGC